MAMIPPNAGMMARPGVNPEQMDMPAPQEMNIDMQQFQNAVSNLSPESMQTLDQHLTPKVKEAIAELFGTDVAASLQDIGPDEPTINIPVSVVASAYPAETIEDSITMMGQDFASKGQQEIPGPPQGGLGGAPQGAPQTNVPPGPMPTGMV